jgi:hypothetical protein
MNIYELHYSIPDNEEEYYVIVPIYSWDKGTVPLLKTYLFDRKFGIRKEKKMATIFEPNLYPKIVEEYDKVPDEITIKLMAMGYIIL